MSCRRSRWFVAVLTTGLMFASSLQAAPQLVAAPTPVAGVMVQQPWARASAGAATTGVAYVTLQGGAQADALTGASTPIAAAAQAHETIDDNGVMRMRAVPVVPIPPGQTVTFAPGGYHIMLTGLKRPLTAGQAFALTLTFAHAAPVTVDVPVRAIGAGGPMHDHMR